MAESNYNDVLKMVARSGRQKRREQLLKDIAKRLRADMFKKKPYLLSDATVE